ncbi:MAG: tRNA pseudouridine(38-40) synthase TruA [Candidatus Kapabacteria bacterium]|nr:tRNA pseudouridine(38-40) synthase TruA [Candidatus Kapabacteria bacterium]
MRQKRYKLTIEYDGSRYRGWQIQPNVRTIQGELITALRAATGDPTVTCTGAGRTDAGVHALGQVAHTDLVTRMTPEELCAAINAHLPADIHVLTAEPVSHRFDARKSAVARSYLYQIALRRGAFVKDYAWWVQSSLDIARMKRAGELLEGSHDFRSFAKPNPETNSYRVLLEEVRIEQHGALVLIRLTASHFLWHMARAIVGTLVRIGKGEIDDNTLLGYLHTPTPEPLKHLAPAAGLFLERVYYKGDSRGGELIPTINLRS